MTPLAVAHTILWVLVVVLALVVLALARQVSLLHARISPVGALMLARGLTVGAPVPELAVEDLAGAHLHIGGARADGKCLLVMFVSPTCPVCKVLLPVLKSSRRDEQAWLEIVLASDGETAAQRAFVAAAGLEAFRYVVDEGLGRQFQVGRLPYAVLVDAGGILRARGLINSREHLESLFEAQRLGVASVQEYLERKGHHAAA